MNAFVALTGGDDVRKAATREQRREAIAYCFDQAPLHIAIKIFSRASRRVNIYQIYGLDEKKVPIAKIWRRLTREMFIDICDKAWMFPLRERKAVREFKQHRFDLFQTTTQL